MPYQTILTNFGLAAVADAIANAGTVQLHEMAVGDGNGNEVTPNPAQTALVREVYRAQLNSLVQDPNNPNYVIAELVIPSNVGGWTVREIGVYDVLGNLVMVGNFPATYKPVINEGATRDLVIRAILDVAAADVVQLVIDPSVVLASRQWVEDNFDLAIQAPGGTTGQVLRKASNAPGDVEWYDPLAAQNILVNIVQENQTLAESQTVVTLAVATTAGAAVYVDGVRLRSDQWTVNSPTQLTLAQSYPDESRITIVQNEPNASTDFVRTLQRNAPNGVASTNDQGYLADTFQTPFAHISSRLAAGTSTMIEIFGDGTYAGQLAAGGTATQTPAQALQSMLRDFYDNTALTVINSGVVNNGTADVIATWVSAMAVSPAQAIIIGYGLKDAGAFGHPQISESVFALNLRYLVRKAREAGKIVILDTPNPAVNTGGGMTQTIVDRVRIFAQAVRAVALEMAVPLIDSFEHFSRIFRFPDQVYDYVPEANGALLTQAGYTARGYWIGAQFTGYATLDAPCHLPALHPTFRGYGNLVRVSALGSRVKVMLVANRFKLPLFVTNPGFDIYVATDNTSNRGWLNVQNNGAAIVANIRQNNIVAGQNPVDLEYLVLRNPRPGINYLTLTTSTGPVGFNDVGPIGFCYLRARETDANYITTRAAVGAEPIVAMRHNALGDLEMRTSASGTSDNVLMTDIPFGMAGSTGSIEFEATLAEGTGIVIGGGPALGAGGYGPDFTFFRFPATSELRCRETTAAGAVITTVIGSIPAGEVTFRFERDGGVMKVFVNGTALTPFVPATTRYGGFLGLYAFGASKFVRLKNLRIR